MYCKYCGKQIEDDREICEECETKQNKIEENVEVENTQEMYTNNDRVEVIKEIPNTNYQQNNTNYNSNNSNTSSENQKSKLAAGLFGIFLGAFGVHNFYLGFTGKAIAQLLITVLSCGFLAPVSSIWGLIEGILILAGDTSRDAYGNQLKN